MKSPQRKKTGTDYHASKSFCHQQGLKMTQAEFTASLIEKLNQLKRDQEIRESLEDVLLQFQECEPWWIEMKDLPRPENDNQRYRSSEDAQRKLRQLINAENKRPIRNVNQEFPKGIREMRAPPVACQKTFNAFQRRQSRHFQTSNSTSTGGGMTVVGYCFSGNPVPYRTKVRGRNITLRQFKALLNRKGHYRYFFKKTSNEFGTNIVFEEVIDDNDVIPLWENKIFALVEEVE